MNIRRSRILRGHNSSSALRPIAFIYPRQARQFTCAVCGLVPMVAPRTHSPCGMLYCEACTRSTKFCPTCGQLLEKQASLLEIANPGVYKSFLTLELCCPDEPRRKAWRGTLADFKLHQNVCEFTRVACPRACGCQLLRKEMEQHVVSECRLGRGSMPIAVPVVPATSDANLEGRCKYWEAGCEFKGADAERVEHEREAMEYHMDIVWKYAERLKSQPANIPAAVPVPAPAPTMFSVNPAQRRIAPRSRSRPRIGRWRALEPLSSLRLGRRSPSRSRSRSRSISRSSSSSSSESVSRSRSRSRSRSISRPRPLGGR